MKRELNSRSRRKWVAGGVLAFGSIALLSTGFATWVIGATKAYADGEVTVTVDTVENASFVVEASPVDASIVVGETVVNTAGHLVSTKSTVTGDLTVSFALTVTKGKTAKAPKGVTYTLLAGAEDNDSLTVGSQELTGTYARAGSSWTYLAAPDAVAEINDWTADTSGTLDVYTKTVTAVFEWGSFFDSVSPLNFYNTKYSGVTDPTTLSVEGDKVEKELKAMRTALTGATLSLRIEVTQVD